MLVKGPVRQMLNIFRDVLSGCSICILLSLAPFASIAGFHKPVRVLNFYGSCGFVHDSQGAALQMVESICKANGWKVTTTNDPGIFKKMDMRGFDVVIFNNNCGNLGRIFTPEQQQAFQSFIRKGGGFLGIHCAGAIWKEETEFQQWYEQLVGTKLIVHPEVQDANCIVENTSNSITTHLPVLWKLKDEFHTMQPNPRSKVDVLISVDENSYSGKEKMYGDHPVVWTHVFDGGKAFFSSLGHTKEMYVNPDFVKLIEEGIKWCAGSVSSPENIPLNQEGLIVDLDADKGVVADSVARVERWINQIKTFSVKEFVKRAEGRKDSGEGRPLLNRNVALLNGHNTLAFKKQELIALDEDAFDHLITGSGYTWLCILSVGDQSGELKDVNSFFGTLKNGGYYEGIWAGLNDNNSLWIGSRNGKSFGRWDSNNPYVSSHKILNKNQYYLLMGRMEKGLGTVTISLYLNNAKTALANQPFPVNINANASRLAIGQERDAIEHPGKESFIGEIARFLLYERPLTDSELNIVAREMGDKYGIKHQ